MPPQDDLIGYLLLALDARQMAAIDELLQIDDEIREQLQVLGHAFELLQDYPCEVTPPAHLAQVTCRIIRQFRDEQPGL